jgi:hypothetical protein
MGIVYKPEFLLPDQIVRDKNHVASHGDGAGECHDVPA